MKNIKRQNIRDRLKESEEKFRAIFENANDGILIADIKTKKFTMANRAICQMLGYNSQEIKNLGVGDIHPKKFLPYVIEQFKKQIKKEISVSENLPVKRKDGSIFYADVNASPVRIHGKLYLVGIFRDVTEQKKVQEELTKNENRYRSYIEVTKQLGWTTDAKGMVTEDIPSWRAYTGQSFEHAKGWNWLGAIHPDDAKHTAEVWKKAVKAKSIYETEYRVRGKDGKYQWFFARGLPVLKKDGTIREWVGTCINITERKKAEEELQGGKEKWSSLTENTNDIIMIVDKKGTIQYINKTLGNYTPEKTIGKSLYNYVPKEQANLMNKQLKKVFKTGKTESYEISSNIPQVGSVWFSTKIVPIKSDEGVSNAILISTDITERKKIDEALHFTRFAVDNAVDPMVCVSQDARYIDVNDAFCRSVGYSREELLSMTVHDIDPNYPAKIWPKFWEKLKQRGSLTFESCFSKKDGKVFPIEVILTFFKYKGKEYHCGLAHDITERKKIEEKIKIFSDAIAGAFDCFILTDMKGNITYANESAITTFRYTPKEFLKLNTNKLDVHQEVAKKIIQEMMVKGKWSGEVMNIKKNKKEFPTFLSAFIIKDDKGNPKGMMGILRDISKQKQAEEVLRASEARYRLLAETLPQKIFIKDRNLVYIFCNKNYAQDLKIEAEEIKGKTDNDFYPKDLAEKYRKDDKRIMESEKTEYIEEKYIQDGKEFWVQTVKTPVRDEQSKVIGILGVFWDITERKKAEQEIKQKSEELEKFNRLFVDRELKMVELKKKIKELEKKTNRKT